VCLKGAGNSEAGGEEGEEWVGEGDGEEAWEEGCVVYMVLTDNSLDVR
jgi:hypothetical protein